MRRPKKTRKHQGKKCLDRISSLPDDVLGHILSFLPTRFAVSTSILSTRWRHLFTLTTCLSFDDEPCFGHPKENERIEATRRFKEFVDKVVELHQISLIKKFSLVCLATYDDLILNQWVINAVEKGVQEFYWKLGGEIDWVLDHAGLFMCETLVSLKIIGGMYYKIQIPLSVSLPKLKILHLDHVLFFDFSSMERLFSRCGLLEELTLRLCACKTGGNAIHCTRILKVLTIENCYFLLGELEIDAPNLAYLTYSLNIGVKIVPYSCSFVKAELNFECTNEDSVDHERELLKAAAYKATKLRFGMDSVQLLNFGDEEQTPDFHSLSSLHLRDCPCNAWEHVTSLLDKSPQLETLTFESGMPCCLDSDDESPDYCDYCYSGSPSDISLLPFSCSVKVIEVLRFCGHMGSLLFLGHLLKNASILERLIIYTIPGTDPYQELTICKDLLWLPRASTDCHVEVHEGNTRKTINSSLR
ncbi:F-box protein At4g22280-like [Silene latifolia]|uniref:F-box protein At4g22280-like n=1 Tax=Silene latifolia TaxID=37657 RepID=UPI003D779CF1